MQHLRIPRGGVGGGLGTLGGGVTKEGIGTENKSYRFRCTCSLKCVQYLIRLCKFSFSSCNDVSPIGSTVC